MINFRIPRANVNIGFDWEEAILEGIDDAFEAANGKTQVECWIKKDTNGYSFLLGDIAGGANYTKLFNVPQNREYYEQYHDIEHLNQSTSVFGAGSLSHLHVSNEVCFFTKYNNENIVLRATKTLVTGDFIVEEVVTTPEEILSKYNLDMNEIDISKYDSLLYVRNFNRSTNQSVKSFREKEQFIGFEKNLRITFADKLEKAYSLMLNGNKLTSLDIFHKDKIDEYVQHIGSFEITLQELFEIDTYYKDDIYAQYYKVFNDESVLLSQSVKVNLYSYDTKYFNNTYSKQNPNDFVKFNLESSGYWIFRNGRKIGNPILLRTIHPSLNNFRASIEFNPVFDKYFGIQVNKNRYVLDDTLKEVIDIKISQIIKERRLSKFNDLISFDNTSNKQKSNEEGKSKKIKNNDPMWRRAEKYALRAVELELPNFRVIDVSRSNIGYDLKAINSDTFEEIYIEAITKNGR